MRICDIYLIAVIADIIYGCAYLNTEVHLHLKISLYAQEQYTHFNAFKQHFNIVYKHVIKAQSCSLNQMDKNMTFVA